jgi:hypothetical protein
MRRKGCHKLDGETALLGNETEEISKTNTHERQSHVVHSY